MVRPHLWKVLFPMIRLLVYLKKEKKWLNFPVFVSFPPSSFSRRHSYNQMMDLKKLQQEPKYLNQNPGSWNSESMRRDNRRDTNHVVC